MKTYWIGEVYFKNQKHDVFRHEDECGFADIELDLTGKNLLLIAGQIELSATSGIIDGAVWNFIRFETPIKQE
jgi:hypothetical protein